LVATLETVVAEVERAGLAAPAIVVVGTVVRLRERIAWFDASPLFGERVLITRPIAQAGEIAAQLWGLGAEPLIVPTIAIEPPDDPVPAQRAVATVREYRWIVFTSQNGVEAFFRELARRGEDARALGGVRVAAIGPKTAAVLERYGIRPDFVPARYISEAVADGLLERTGNGERVLLFRAQEARDVLPERLRAAGRPTDVVAAYKTVFERDDELEKKLARATILTFTSASTVNGFVHALGARLAEAVEGKRIACIGPVTAQAAEAAGLHVDHVASAFTIEGLIEALEGVPV
jgi:uroporphyrinogen III methyltransferase/synthase